MDKGVSQRRVHLAQIGIGNDKQVYIIHVRRIAWTLDINEGFVGVTYRSEENIWEEHHFQ